MTRRELVRSPDELRPGDRVEVLAVGRGTVFVTVDLVYRNGNWWGFVVDVDGAVSNGSPFGPQVLIGDRSTIDPDNYPAGRVFIRRRSREDYQVERCREAT